MGLIQQETQAVVAAEKRVDVVIVVRVITMIGSRSKDRVEVQRRDSQILQVIEILGDPIQIAAFETVMRGRRVPRFKTDIRQTVAACKTIGKNLIED